MNQTAAMPPLTALLAARARQLGADDTPDWARELARQCILDWFAVTIAGATEPLVDILVAEAEEQGGRTEAGLVGRRGGVNVGQAALINGAASHALDYDDVNLAVLGHPTVAVFPGLLALAAREGKSGRDTVTAFIAGYETACRIGLAMAPGHYGAGFHATSTVGCFGAAAACARLLELDQERTEYALGLAGTQAAGLKSMFGTMAKPFHAGNAANNGLRAALLARRGFTARPDVLECAQGFAATQTTTFNPAAALADPADGFHIRANLFKYHAACYLTHATIDAAAALRRRPEVKVGGMASIRLRTDAGSDGVCNIAQPRTGLEAKFSLRLTAAMALGGIDTASFGSYSDSVANDPVLTALRDLVTVELMPGWRSTYGEVSLTLMDGRVIEAKSDSGIPAADIAEQGHRLRRKYHSLVDPVLGRTAAERLAKLIDDLDELDDVSQLVRASLPGAN